MSNKGITSCRQLSDTISRRARKALYTQQYMTVYVCELFKQTNLFCLTPDLFVFGDTPHGQVPNIRTSFAGTTALHDALQGGQTKKNTFCVLWFSPGVARFVSLGLFLHTSLVVGLS